MSPYQHLFSTNAVLNVWRNLRHNARDQNDLLLTFQCPVDDVRASSRSFAKGKRKNGKDGVQVEEREMTASSGEGGRASMSEKSMTFVVPWRSMQAQKRALREKDKELAEALVGLLGEMGVCDLPPHLQTSIASNELVQTRHIIAGLSRQLSRVEISMHDNAPFSLNKNLYTGGEIARKFLPSIKALFQTDPVPRRMLFELLLELKDAVFMGFDGCSKSVLQEEMGENSSDGGGWAFLEEMDELMVRALSSLPTTTATAARIQGAEQRQLPSAPREEDDTSLAPRQSALALSNQGPSCFLTDPVETLTHLDSLTTTSEALSRLPQLPLPIPDFMAKSIILLRRSVDRHTLAAFTAEKAARTGTCSEYARCMKWAGAAWKAGGGCKRGCSDEGDNEALLPSWHRGSRWFEGG